MNDFTNVMIEQPNTAMVIVPAPPPDTPEPSESVVADPSSTPPPESFFPDLPETYSNYEGPVGVTGIFNGNVTTGCSYDPLSHSAHRAIDDIVVPGSVGKYPLKMTRYYNSRQQYYAAPGAIGLSPGWSYEYAWLLWGAGYRVVSPHGNVSDFFCGAGPVGVSDWWDDGAHGAHPNGGTWRLADGGKVVLSGGHATDIYDPNGNRTRIAYNPPNVAQPGERVKVTEPGGRCLWFIYGTRNQPNQGTGWGDGTWLITRVEAYDSDGSPGSPTHPNGNLTDSVEYSYDVYDPVDPDHPGNRRQKMLTGVTYSDGTHATYDYQTDNVHEGQDIQKRYPLLRWCDDVRYNGPMRTIAYRYQPHYPHGFIWSENYHGIAVSTIDPDPSNQGTTFTERRGDGPSRSFTYTQYWHCQPNTETCNICTEYGENDMWPYRAPQQMLKSYTDFLGNNTQLDYDNHWYINSVKDANQHITTYERGNPPPDGIGEIKKIYPPGGYPGIYTEYGYSDHGHYITSVRDENGNTTTIHRDGNNRIQLIEYPVDGNTPASYEEFTYNGFGQVLTHHLRNGAWERFDYDTRGLLTDKYNPKVNSVPGGQDPHTHYDYYTAADGKLGWIDRVKTMSLPANWLGHVASETYEYDKNTALDAVPGRGLVTMVTHADGWFQSFRYDQYGNKVNEWNELGEGTSYAYDSYNRVIVVTKSMYSMPSEITTYDYAPTEGDQTQASKHTSNSPYWVTAPTGIKTNNIYDQNWRKTSSAVAGRTTWFHYDPVGNLEYVTDPRGSQNDLTRYTTHTQYDSRNRKWHVWDAQNHQTTFTYDDASNLIDIQRPDTTHETKTYDALKRVLTDTVPKSSNPTVNLTTWFTYNPSGTIWKVTDARGSGRGDPNYTTTFEYNASDQRTKLTYPDASFQAWAYDDAHNMKSRTTVNGETKYFAYDNRNRKYGEAWENFSGDWAIYGYDAASRLRRAVNGRWEGQTPITICDVHRDYDAAGRLTMDKQDIDGANNGLGPLEVHYVYDPALRGADGKPTHMYVGPGEGYDYTFGYDDMGRLETISPTGGNPWFQYHYDNASNETQRDSLRNHVSQSYDPDELNRPRKVELQYNGSSFWRESYDYYPIGRLHAVTRGNRQDQFDYYLDGELRSVFYDATAGEAPDPSEIPPAEDAGKQKTVDDFVGLSVNMDPGAPQTNARTVTYDLDNAGNRTNVTDTLSGTTAYTPNNLNQYINNVGGDAINNGFEHEIGSYKSVSYTYMKDEHLIRVTNGGNTYEMAYDALGRCVKRTLLAVSTMGPEYSPRPTPTPRPPPTPAPHPSPPPPSPTPPPGFAGVTKYYIYDGERPILEYDGNGALAGYNLYGKGVDEILLRNDPTLPEPQTVYYQQDHEGSVTFLTYNPPTGVSPILEYYRYDVFGKPAIYGPPPNWSVRPASLYSNRFLFTGREYNAAFGFYEYRARAYHPGLGRFMSEDPKGFVRRAGLGASPSEWTFAAHPDEAEFNLFRYCGSDPIDFTDPMGLDAMANAMAVAEVVVPGQYEYNQMVANYQAGNYGNAAGWGVTWVGSAAVGVATGTASTRLQAGLRAAESAAAGRNVLAVIGKYLDKPSYIQVGEHLNVKVLDVPRHLWKQMSPAERWTKTQTFLDAIIAREGDFLFNKPIKSIASQSGEFRKELEHISGQGYGLSQDGWRMTKIVEDASTAAKDVPFPLKP